MTFQLFSLIFSIACHIAIILVLVHYDRKTKRMKKTYELFHQRVGKDSHRWSYDEAVAVFEQCKAEANE